MTRKHVSYKWHLRQLMAEHQLWKTTELTPLLRDRGINLSPAQVYRLVAEQPERLSLRTLVALCDIFECTPNDLIEPVVSTAARKVTAGAAAGTVGVSEVAVRPTRARIIDPNA